MRFFLPSDDVQIFDMIKRNESDVRNIDFEFQV